jgi:hypothetical protein
VSLVVARHLCLLGVVVSFVYLVMSASEKIPLPMRLGLIPELLGVCQTCESWAHYLGSDTDKRTSMGFAALQLLP